MTDESNNGYSAADALDMAVGTAMAAALVNDAPEKTVDLATLPPNCLNCGAAVRGRYCVDCGQTTDTHVPTLVEVAGDAIAAVFNLESRLWRTFCMLFFSPGKLTQEFLAGRRARYVPPLRLYLVLSLFTFLIMSLPDGNEDLNELVEANSLTQEQTDAIANAPDEATRAAAINDVVNAQLEAAGDADGKRASFSDQVDCENMDLPFNRGGAVDSAVREACATGKEDNFDGIIDAFVDNLPLLAFMVIPVMAVVFKVFYAFSGRNYLSHLIFLCHTHAFTFLLFVVITVLRYIGWAVPFLSQTMTVLGGLLFVFYPPVYYFLAMRRVYGQGRLLTLVKELLLMFVYMFAVMFVFATGLIAVMLAS